jgi:uroporphyrinogen-III synthase
MKALKVLSTKKLSPQLIDKAEEEKITIVEKEFILIQPINGIKKYEEVSFWLKKENAVAIFTSINAVNIVAKFLEQFPHGKPSWKIYSLEGKTKEQLNTVFPGKDVITAGHAAELADKIVKDKIKEAVFFCGNKRMDELPAILKSNHITINEVIVYETIETPEKLNSEWDAILFFSPSAVNSFFLMNTIEDKTVCFAIGETTANSIKRYTKNKILSSDFPSQEKLLMIMIDYFKKRRLKWN